MKPLKVKCDNLKRIFFTPYPLPLIHSMMEKWRKHTYKRICVFLMKAFIIIDRKAFNEIIILQTYLHFPELLVILMIVLWRRTNARLLPDGALTSVNAIRFPQTVTIFLSFRNLYYKCSKVDRYSKKVSHPFWNQFYFSRQSSNFSVETSHAWSCPFVQYLATIFNTLGDDLQWINRTFKLLQRPTVTILCYRTTQSFKIYASLTLFTAHPEFIQLHN